MPLYVCSRLREREWCALAACRPTPENVEAMLKLCRGYAESARRAVRTVRKDAMMAVKALASEDERHRAEKEVQKVTDEYIAAVDKIAAQKEKAITAV